MKRKKIGQLVFIFLLTLSFSVFTTRALLISLLMTTDYRVIVYTALFTLLILSAMSISRKSFWITLGLGLLTIAILVAVANKGGAIHVVQQTIYDYGKWLWQSITSLRRDVDLFLNITSMLVTIGVSLVCFFLIVRKIRIFALVLLTMPVYIFPYINNDFTGFLPMLAGAIILAILFALSVFRKHGTAFQETDDINLELRYLLFVVPMIIVLVLGARAISRAPRQDRSREMNRMIRKIEKKLEEWDVIKNKEFEFGGEFSLQSSGYQPGGTLGGNIIEKDGLSMMVESKVPLYLKGSIQDRYTGNAWTPGLRTATTIRSTNISNYVTDASFSEKRVFNAAMRKLNISLDRADYDQFFKEGEAVITHYGLKTNTLFYPENLIFVEPSKQFDGKIKINNNSELYFPYRVMEHTKYTVRYRYFLTGNPYSTYLLQQLGPGILDDWLAKEENSAFKEKLTYIYERYAESESAPQSVKDLALKVTNDAKASNRFDMATAIALYLKENYPYTLSPGSVPTWADFVEYFLFEKKMGYCTYFASAMTIMLRSLGIPARYVEGFVAKDENLYGRIYSVLQKDSHAWVEVFFEGVGWITFEPTPSARSVVVEGEGTGEGEGVIPSFEPEDKIWDWGDAAPEDFFVEPDIGFWEDHEHEYDFDYKGRKKVAIPWLAVLLALFGVAVLFFPVKIFLIKTKLFIDSKKNPNRSIVLYYNRILKLLEIAGMGLKPGETLYEMTDRKHILVKSQSRELKKATEAFYAIRFADMQRDKKDFNNVYFVYKKMHENIRFFLGPWRFFNRRYVKGLRIW